MSTKKDFLTVNDFTKEELENVLKSYKIAEESPPSTKATYTII